MDYIHNFAGKYATSNTFYYVEQVRNADREFIDFEKTDGNGNTIITFGFSRFCKEIQTVCTYISEYFYLNFRNSLNLYIATLEFVKSLSAKKQDFCTYDEYKNTFLYQIYVQAISFNPVFLIFCRSEKLLGLDRSTSVNFDILMEKYSSHFQKSVENLRSYSLL